MDNTNPIAEEDTASAPHDLDDVKIPRWISRNLRHFVHSGIIHDKTTNDTRPHPNNGRTVGITSGERRLLFEIMHFMPTGFMPVNQDNASNVDLAIVAENLDVSMRQVRSLLRSLIEKGALTVKTIPGKSPIYEFTELFDQCRQFEIQKLTQDEPGF